MKTEFWHMRIFSREPSAQAPHTSPHHPRFKVFPEDPHTAPVWHSFYPPRKDEGLSGPCRAPGRCLEQAEPAGAPRLQHRPAPAACGTCACLFWIVSFTVIRSPFQSPVALAMSSPTFFGD